MTPSILLPCVVLAVTVSIWTRAWLSRRRLEFRVHMFQLLGLACQRGLPLPRLLAVAKYEHTRSRHVALAATESALASGASLAEALRAAGARWFGPDVVHALEAADGTERTGATLLALAEEDATQLQARHRLGLALLYPALLVLLVVGLHGLVTRCLGGTVWYYQAKRPPSVEAFAALWLAVGAVAAWVISMLMRTYDLRPGARALATARLLRLTGLLAGAGLRVPEALRRAARACRHGSVERAAHDVAERLEAGDRSGDAWAALRLPPALTMRMGALSSRSVSAALADLTRRLAARAQLRRERFLRWMQPASILLVAGAVLVEYKLLIAFIANAREAVGLW